MKKKYIINIIQVILIILFTISLVPKEFQNDTFFTIALGERTLEYGIEKVDQLVWHENLEFIHLRWLFDVVIYAIYNIFNFVGIYVFVIIIAIIQSLLYYHILNKLTNKKWLSFTYTLCVIYCIQNEFTGRAQIISFTLFLLEFYCIEMLLKTNKKRYFISLVIIPLLLVNFHASVFPVYFVFYLPYIVEFILSKLNLKKNNDRKIIIEKKNINKLFILIILGIILGFCSPIGLKAYSYMFNVMDDGVSAKFIDELQSLNIISNVTVLMFIILVFSLIAFTKTKLKITDLFFIMGFAFLGIATTRCIFFFYLISSICIFRILSDCIDYYEINIDFIDKKAKYLICVIFFVFIIINSFRTLSKRINENYINTQEYPVDATNYILKNLDISDMRIYNHFNFGSYLEFNGIQVFVDSRSEMYTEKFNDGCTILNDWYNVVNGGVSYTEIFDKYQITHALLYNTELINVYICNDDSWKLLYQDDSFSLYERVDK